jgi:hypothetical protein
MSAVIHFASMPDLEPEDNLKGFIDACRNELTLFGKDLDFDSNVWDLTDHVELKARGNKKLRVPFCNFESTGDREFEPMQMPFLLFAKAYFRYMHALRPTKVVAQRVAVLRTVELALRQLGKAPCVLNITTDVLNRAVDINVKSYAESTAYRHGVQLEMLVKFLTDNDITLSRLDWRNPIRRNIDTVKVGKEFEEKRSKKLPSQAALDALPMLYHMVSSPGDRLVMSIVAILLSAPDRINEVLLLPADCEVEQTKSDGGKAYGLRWWPAKGAEPMVKWVIPSMVDVVKQAIKTIKRLTDDARAVARWYEQNPNQIYLSREYSHLRNREYVALSDVGSLVFAGQVSVSAARIWCKRVGVTINKSGATTSVRFDDVQRVICSDLPNNFPFLSKELGLKYSDALFVVPANLFHREKSTHMATIESVTTDSINSRLGARSKYHTSSIFSEHEFTEPDGSPIKVTTHQFRHYLNTIAQQGGLSQIDIAKWSGRRDIRQNEAYDHTTTQERIQKIREVLGDDSETFGSLSKLPDTQIISRKEFQNLKVPTVHMTDIGACVHDFSMSPCSYQAACETCSELVCIKGDGFREGRVRQLHQLTLEYLEKAKVAEKDGEYGANRWVEQHQVKLEIYEQMIEIFDNPSIANGAVFRPNTNKQASPLPMNRTANQISGTTTKNLANTKQWGEA